MRRSPLFIAAALLIAGCAEVNTSSPSSAEKIAALPAVTVPPAPLGTNDLTYCGVTTTLNVEQPEADVPQEVREIWGTWAGPYHRLEDDNTGTGCAVVVFEKVTKDGAARVITFADSPWGYGKRYFRWYTKIVDGKPRDFHQSDGRIVSWTLSGGVLEEVDRNPFDGKHYVETLRKQ